MITGLREIASWIKGEGAIEKTLDQLKAGQYGVVTRVDGQGAVRRRMADMGITPGANVLMRRAAPWGDPVQINVRGYELTLRKAEARSIRVDVKSPTSSKRW